MATLPIAPTFCESAPPVPGVDERSLAEAFSSFAQAAASLERSYSQLQLEVRRLRHELEETNHDLASSLQENHRMRQHLDRILEGLPCGVLVVEADGCASIANPEARHLLGVSSRAPIPGAARELLDQIVSCSELEYRFAGREPRWIAIRRAELSAQDGGSSIFIVEDVSLLKRLQLEHEQLRRRQALAEMSATLAHEVRNPLGSMELFVGLLSESELGEDQRSWTENLQAGLRTLAATVNNVLHFHSQPPLALAPVDLGELLASLERFLRPQAQQAGVTIHFDHALAGFLVTADRHGVEQVILNLARNAFAVLPRGGKLEISGEVRCAAQSRSACLQVSDNGPGIAADCLQRIFHPGFSTSPGNPGLGLAVCKTIMKQHGGAIRVDSRLGSGTTFTLEFPLPEGGQ